MTCLWSVAFIIALSTSTSWAIEVHIDQPQLEGGKPCKNMSAGDECALQVAGKELKGLCAFKGKSMRLWCKPNGVPGGGRDGKGGGRDGKGGGAGAPMVKACKNMSAGDECTWQKGEKELKGLCVEKEGKPLWCKPNGKPGGDKPDRRRRRRSGGGAGAPMVKACKNMSAGDECTWQRGEKELKGLCVEKEGKPLWCKPKGMPGGGRDGKGGGRDGKGGGAGAPMVKACKNMSAGDECTFIAGKRGETELKGKGLCVEKEGKPLWCKPKGMPGGGRDGKGGGAVPPMVKACKNVSAGDSCTWQSGEKELKGLCTPKSGGLWCTPRVPGGPGGFRPE